MTTRAYGTSDWSPPFRRLLPWALLWLLLALLVGAGFVRQASAAAFAGRARATVGTVVAREPDSHATVRAVYDADGRRYEVSDSFIGPPNPTFESVRVGDQVTVYFDPSAPEVAVLSDPGSRAPTEVGFALLAILLLPTAFVGAAIATIPIWRRFF